MGQLTTFFTLLSFYTILVISANLTVGMANLLTLCQAAFCGVGAYLSAFLLMHWNLPFVIVALAVMLITGLSSLFVSAAAIRLKGDYFVLATLAFQIIVYQILYNWTPVTGGPYGTDAFDRIRLFGAVSLDSSWAFAGFALLIAFISVLFVAVLHRSPFGRLLQAIRTDDKAVEALGYDVSRLKTHVFFLSAALAGLSGLLYAAFNRYVEPTAFSTTESLTIITALFLGGTGKWRGSVLGAFIIVLLPEILRAVGMDAGMADSLKQVLYGLLLVVMLFVRPQGLMGEKQQSL